ncbi:MAG: aminotransferase class III-fold pyridoxal phosphate-dependent enzyme [Anaerolineaceae bacterium]|nr:MAG: aminotransferase class III-fold pyridoxal phosphate-dependent enzyme [Anaerolineaceae bacterium]
MIAYDEDIRTTEDRHTSGAYSKRPLTLVRGEGVRVWDDADNEYIDATSGQGVALLGHAHPQITAAISAQSGALITCPEIFYNDRRAELYRLLASVMPDGMDRFFLCNSGAEAMEGALKAARLLTERRGVVAAVRGFHGRTLGALALTWNKKYRQPFAGWTAEDVAHVAYNDLDAARAVIGAETAAVVVEAVQGEGGVHPADVDYLRGLRQICDETGALLIVDEVQTGFGRTGRWFAFEHADIIPDIVALGKGIAGGVPMGAVAWRSALGALPRGSHGSTFGGNPLACAAASATIETLAAEDLPAHSAELGAWAREEINRRDWSAVREVRGLGLMIGIELRGRVTPILQGLQARGVLALPAGLNVLRLLPPLIISRDELLAVIDAIGDTLHDNA